MTVLRAGTWHRILIWCVYRSTRKKARHDVCTWSFLFDSYQSTSRRKLLLFTFSSFFFSLILSILEMGRWFGVWVQIHDIHMKNQAHWCAPVVLCYREGWTEAGRPLGLLVGQGSPFLSSCLNRPHFKSQGGPAAEEVVFVSTSSLSMLARAHMHTRTPLHPHIHEHL